MFKRSAPAAAAAASTKPTRSVAPNPAVSRVEAANDAINSIEDIQLTEEDEQNPELLAELAELTGDKGEEDTGDVNALEMPADQEEQTIESLETEAAAEEQQARLDALKAEIKLLGEQRDTDGLKRAFAEYDALKKQLGQASPAKLAAATVKPVAPTPAPQIQDRPVSQPPVTHKAADSVEQQLQLVTTRQAEYKKIALLYKKNNDMVNAKKHLAIAKSLDHFIEQLEVGIPLSAKDIIPPAPPSPTDLDLIANTAKQPAGPSYTSEIHEEMSRELGGTPEKSRVSEDGDEALYEKIIKQLQKQENLCMQNAGYYYNHGKNDKAVVYFAQKKACVEDLAVVRAWQSRNLPPPKYKKETKNVTIARSNQDLQDTDFEVTVVKCINLSIPNVTPHDLKVSVLMDFEYPTAETGLKQKTPLIGNGTTSPQVDASFKFTIDRKVKFPRFIARKGVRFEVFYEKSGLLGFMNKEVSVGKAELKLLALETECTLISTLNIVDSHKSVCGKLEVKARVRDPLKGPDIREETLQWLSIEPGQSITEALQLHSSRTATPVVTPITTPVKVPVRASPAAIEPARSVAAEPPSAASPGQSTHASTSKEDDYLSEVFEAHHIAHDDIPETSFGGEEMLPVAPVAELVTIAPVPTPRLAQPLAPAPEKTPEKAAPVPAPRLAQPLAPEKTPEKAAPAPKKSPAASKQGTYKPRPFDAPFEIPDPVPEGFWETANPDSAIYLISSEMLEEAVTSLQQQLAAAKKNKQDTHDIESELLQATTRQQTLQILVETQQLSIEAYLNLLRKRIEDEKALARFCVAQDQKTFAMSSLKRSKKLAKEISTIETAIKNGDIE